MFSFQTSSTIPQAICIAKIWCISSATFLILLIIELYIGLTTFEYNSYKILFIVFGIGKVFWRIFTIYYVECFRVDLQKGIENGRRSTAQGDENLVPVFKMVVTSPENYNSDVTDTEAEAEVKEWSKPWYYTEFIYEFLKKLNPSNYNIWFPVLYQTKPIVNKAVNFTKTDSYNIIRTLNDHQNFQSTMNLQILPIQSIPHYI